MSMIINAQLPEPHDLKDTYPLKPELVALKAQRDAQLRDIFTGASDKFILIIGPCSADSEDSVLEYMLRLAQVANKVKDKILIVPRVYTNKPRTTGKGYKGMLHQPNPTNPEDLLAGLVAIRKLHLRVIGETGLTAADEMLYPENRSYFDDVLSSEAVGARSVEDQQHRMVASSLDIPVGMKNPTSGDIAVMINSIAAAQAAQRFIYRQEDVTTSGNPLAHAILRGGVDKNGSNIPNYHYEDLARLDALYKESGLVNPAVIIDTNHSNSGKQYLEQVRIAEEIMHSRKHNPNLKSLIKGLMIESYLVEGRQDISQSSHTYGQSITDPCLGWDASEKLIYSIADRV